jgi:oligopeptide transport system permease protein
LVIITVSFFLIRLAPGSPFASEREIPAEVLADLNARYGFDKPMYVQYFNYVKNLVLRGDLGPSTKYSQRSVNEIIAIGFPVTLLVAAVALIWALLIGIPAGIIGAVRQNTAWDYAAMSAAMVGISLPAFVLGPLLILVFAFSCNILPPGGWGTWRHVVLPGITLGAIRAGYIARLTRGGMLEVVRADYIRTARAKGLSEQAIIWRHMLKGGLLPVITYLGPAVAFMLVGSVVVEKIFNVPGIGPYFVDAAINRDWFLVMGIIVLESAFLLSMNLVVDVVYGLVDPRIRYE